MASLSHPTSPVEDTETVKIEDLPKLVETDFVTWKPRMEQFLIKYDDDIWRCIRDGPYVPMTDPADNDGVAYLKPPYMYTDEDLERMEVDESAKMLLSIALPFETYRKVLHCESAKEQWDTLCEQLNGVQEYQVFAYISGESMTQQFERFTSLVSQLKAWGVIYENERLLNKFMSSLPSEWRMYTQEISNFKDLTKMTLTELYSELRTYELQVNKKINQRGRQVNVSFDQLSVEDLEQLHPDDQEEMDLVYQMAMLNLRIKRFTKRTGKSIPEYSSGMRIGFDKSRARCYNCHKTGHFAKECVTSVPSQTQAATTTSDQGVVTDGGYDWSFVLEEGAYIPGGL